MDVTAQTVELDIDVLPLQADAGYGWHAMFRDRPGDTLATGGGCASVSDCLSEAADTIPDNTRVEIRFRTVAAGTWFAEELQTDAEAVAAEMLRRIRSYVGDF